MNTDLRIRAPFATRSPASPHTAPPAMIAAAPQDGYAGSMSLPVDLMPSSLSSAAPAPSPQQLGVFARVALATATLATGILGFAVAASAAPALAPPPPTTVSAPASQGAGSVGVSLSNPARPLPGTTAVDTRQWMATADTAFTARQSGDTQALLRATSEDGVWIRGLRGGPATSTGHVYMTHDELARDLSDHGPLFQQVFDGPSNGRFVLSPDAQAQVQTILLD